MPQKTLGEKVDDLIALTANLAARVDGHDLILENLSKLLEKANGTFTEVSIKLATVEVHTSGIEAIKKELALIKELEKDAALLKKDFEALSKWKDDQKAQEAEWSRRRWAFGPNLLGAIISGLIGFGSSALFWWLNRKS